MRGGPGTRRDLNAGRGHGVELSILHLAAAWESVASRSSRSPRIPKRAGPICLPSMCPQHGAQSWVRGRGRLSAGGPDPPLPQHINELTMKLSVEDVLTRAEALYLQLMACVVSPRHPPTAPLPLPCRTADFLLPTP